MFGISTLLSLLGIPQMMVYGMFVFGLRTLPYQSLQQQIGWRHPSTSRVGMRPARQFLGPDEEPVTLSGVLLPEFTGGQMSIDQLRAMGDQGGAWPLIDGTGTLYGLYVLEKIELTKTVFFADGVARRIEFTITLARVEDDNPAQLGDFSNIPGAIYL